MFHLLYYITISLLLIHSYGKMVIFEYNIILESVLCNYNRFYHETTHKVIISFPSRTLLHIVHAKVHVETNHKKSYKIYENTKKKYIIF